MLDHISLPDAVARQLRQRILNNQVQAGTRLVEASLATEFGVSRGTVREALRRLAGENLIEIVPRRYSVVTRMSARDAEDVCYTRYLLEDASVMHGLAAGPDAVGPALAAELTAALDDMAVAVGAGDMAALVASDTRFHRPLAELGGRPRIARLWATLDSQMGAVLRSEMERHGKTPLEAVPQHRELMGVIMTGDLDRLRPALRAHYLSGFPALGGGAPAAGSGTQAGPGER